MKALGHASTLDLPDQRVAVCGDWHGNLGWARTIACVLSLPRAGRDNLAASRRLVDVRGRHR